MTNLSVQDALDYYQKKYQVIKNLESIVIKEGYQMIEPNFLESYDRFSEKHRRIKRENMVKVIDNDGFIKVLRPDVTTSIISNLIPKWDNGMTLKVFYNETVFSSSSQGIKEQKQFGVEYLGDNATGVDTEVVNLVIALLSAYDLSYQLEVGDASLLNSVFESLDLEADLLDELKGIIYSKNQFELNKFIDQYLEDYSYKSFLSRLFSLQGSIEQISALLKDVEVSDSVRQSLDAFKIFSSNIDSCTVTIDLSMISEFDYYNGIIFKGYLPTIPEAILSGGRYDTKLMGYKKGVPAIGFSLSLGAFLKEVMI